MELLFKENTFSDDFAELLGFVDADISYQSIRSELLTATREMITFIGQSTYGVFLAKYKSATPLSLEDQEMLHLIRYPIAMNTYRMVAPSKDVQHTNQGRLMRTDEHQARPFEWMIDRNNAANERKYYRGVDDLLAYLFKDDNFKQTPEFKKIKALFVSSTSDFEEFFPIQSRLLLIKLQPGIRQAMRDFIAPRIGSEKYSELITQHTTASGISEENKILFSLVKEACVYHALSWAMTRLTVNLLPEGILQNYTSDRKSTKSTKTPEFLQSQLAAQKFGEDASRAFKAIEAHMTELTTPEPDQSQENSSHPYNEDDLFATT